MIHTNYIGKFSGFIIRERAYWEWISHPIAVKILVRKELAIARDRYETLRVPKHR
jgi:hypothetical protein